VTVAVYKSGYMLERLENPTLPVNDQRAGDKVMGAGNQQGRPDESLEPSETVRRTLTEVR
jgi:hypothetical protein